MQRPIALLLLPLLSLCAPAARAQFNIGPSSPTAPVAPLAPAPSATPLPEGAIASVGGMVVSAEDFRPYLERLNADQRTALATDPKKLDQFVRAFVAQRLLLTRALESGWDRKPQNEAQLERVRDNAVADGFLEEMTQPPSDYPPAKEIQAAYDQNLKAFAVPRQTQLAQIFIACPQDAPAEQAKIAADRIQMLAKYFENPKADFAEVATQKSEDPKSAAQGGVVGWLTEEQIHPSIREVAAKLKKGEVSAPFQIKIGWLIVKVNDERPARTLSLDEVRPLIVSRLREARQRRDSAEYMQTLVGDKPLNINADAALEAVKTTN